MLCRLHLWFLSGLDVKVRLNLISHPRGEKSEHLWDLAPRAAVNRSVIPHTGEPYHRTPSEAGREVMENELSVILPFRSLSLCFFVRDIRQV